VSDAGVAGGVARHERWLGLDALRGLSIAAMILVNNPGGWGPRWQYAPLRHAEWHGCTFTDLVFPTFLFCCGVAIVPALSKKVEAGVAKGPLVVALAKRVASLVLLGMLLSAFPLVSFAADEDLFAPLWRTRVPGVLQRIGVCYGIAALLFLLTSVRTQRVVLWSCLVAYWPLITLMPVPGVAAPQLGDLHAFVDRAVFGEHIWREHAFDPEGLLSTIPAIATCMFGVEAGRVLRAAPDLMHRVAVLCRNGLLLMAVGAVFAWFLPLNKYLWTSSYALWTAGIATAGLGLCVHAFEQQGWRRLAHPLVVYGTNALLVFVGSGLVGRMVGRLIMLPTADGDQVSLQQWFFRTVLLPIGDDQLASLAFAILWIVAWYAVLAALYRRNIVWKV
jgi:predicted acyltransferase